MAHESLISPLPDVAAPVCLDHERLLRLLPQLYEAALQPDAGSKILRWLAAVFGAEKAIFIRLDRTHPRDSFMELIGIADEPMRELRPLGLEGDPLWLPHILEMPIGQPFCATDLVALENKASAAPWLRFYHSLPAELRHSFGVVIENSAHHFASLACFAAEGGFDDRVRNALQILAPHIRLAWDISRRVAIGDAGQREAMLSFEQVHQPLAVLDRSGYVIVTNEAARRLFTDSEGMRLKYGRFVFDDLAIQTEFERAVRTVITSMLSGPQVPPQELRVPCGSDRTPYVVTVVPLYRPESRLVLPPEAGCMVAINDHEGVNPLPIGHLVWLYGLTPSEARTCEALHQGGSVEAAAKSLKLSRNTVRSHLKNIYAKVGVANQPQLLQRLLNSTYQRFYDKILGDL